MFKIYFLEVTYGIAFYYKCLSHNILLSSVFDDFQLFTTNKLLVAISYNLRYLTVEK